VFSQPAEVNSFPESGIRFARQLYTDLFTQQMQLYNGGKYNEVLLNPEIDRGHPFFISEELTIGTVLYNNIEYTNIPLQYDVLTDQIITVLPNTNFKISLIKDHVQSFTLLDHYFVNLTNKEIVPGFYELLLNDTMKVIARRTKKSVESSYNNNIIVRRSYIPKSEFYVFNNDQYFLIRNKKSLILVFQNQKEIVNSYIRQMKTSFRKDKEKYIIELVTYCNNFN
jgi:hypothetical protein